LIISKLQRKLDYDEIDDPDHSNDEESSQASDVPGSAVLHDQ
jgi:hypothetical protein